MRQQKMFDQRARGDARNVHHVYDILDRLWISASLKLERNEHGDEGGDDDD